MPTDSGVNSGMFIDIESGLRGTRILDEMKNAAVTLENIQTIAQEFNSRLKLKPYDENFSFFNLNCFLSSLLPRAKSKRLPI